MRRIWIEELAEEIMLQQWEFGTSGFTIHECITCEEHKYFVEDLHVEIEDDVILFYDLDDVLLGNILSAVLKENLLYINHKRINGNIYEDICFKFGHVYIESIAA